MGGRRYLTGLFDDVMSVKNVNRENGQVTKIFHLFQEVGPVVVHLIRIHNCYLPILDEFNELKLITWRNRKDQKR